MSNPKYRQTLSVAIEITTALLSEPSNKDFAMQRIQVLAAEEGVQGITNACAGLANLAALAISKLSEEMGVPELELLQRFALNVQDES